MTPRIQTNRGDILISAGSAIRALGVRDNIGRVGGLLHRFTGADEPDAYDTYFDAETDFRFSEGMASPVYFEHGMNGVLGVRCIGTSNLSLTEEGIAIEAEIPLVDDDVRAIYNRAAAGELGWSSGTAGHLVTYTQTRSYAIHGRVAYHVDHWPLGLDASLTCCPADSENVACVRSIRSILDASPAVDLALLRIHRQAQLMAAGFDA